MGQACIWMEKSATPENELLKWCMQRPQKLSKKQYSIQWQAMMDMWGYLYVLLHLAWVLMLRESVRLSTLDHHAIWKVQESGRCSRDGQPGSCVVLYLGRMLSSCTKDIRSYVSSGTCRREQINSYFDHPTNVPNTSQPTGHNCCDSCAALCTCNNGTCTYDPVWAAPVESTPETRSPVREVSDEQLSTLKKGLLLYKKKWIA